MDPISKEPLLPSAPPAGLPSAPPLEGTANFRYSSNLRHWSVTILVCACGCLQKGHQMTCS